MWLETKDVWDHKQYMFSLQLLGKEGYCQWESFPLAAPNNNDKEQPTTYGKPLKAPWGRLQASRSTDNRPWKTFSRRTSSLLICLPNLLSYLRNATTTSVAWTPTKLTYFFIEQNTCNSIMGKGTASWITLWNLFTKANIQETAVSEYYQYKERKQDYKAFPSAVSMSIDAVHSENYSRLPFQDMLQMWLNTQV